MSTEIWGIIWTRDGNNTEPSWYETKEDAVAEYNSRDDKYWPSYLVVGRIADISIVHSSNPAGPPPWERDYECHYYQDPA